MTTGKGFVGCGNFEFVVYEGACEQVAASGSTSAICPHIWYMYLGGNICNVRPLRQPLWSSGQSFWLQIQRSRVRFPALPDFLSSSGSGTVSTQPREVN